MCYYKAHLIRHIPRTKVRVVWGRNPPANRDGGGGGGGGGSDGVGGGVGGGDGGGGNTHTTHTSKPNAHKHTTHPHNTTHT